MYGHEHNEVNSRLRVDELSLGAYSEPLNFLHGIIEKLLRFIKQRQVITPAAHQRWRMKKGTGIREPKACFKLDSVDSDSTLTGNDSDERLVLSV